MGQECAEVSGASGAVNEALVREKYDHLAKKLIALGRTITTMESCTAGQIASLITDTAGSSAILKGAFVTYSNAAKIMMGVPAEIVEKYGVYSEKTARAMAEACRRALNADFGVGVTGTFGNADPDNPDSVPGEVFFAIAAGSGTKCYHCTMPAQPSRLAYKLYMAEVIADTLIKAI